MERFNATAYVRATQAALPVSTPADVVRLRALVGSGRDADEFDRALVRARKVYSDARG